MSNTQEDRKFTYDWQHHEMHNCRMGDGQKPFTLDLPQCRVYKNIESPQTLLMLKFDNLEHLEHLVVAQDFQDHPLPYKKMSLIPSKTFRGLDIYTSDLNYTTVCHLLKVAD